MNNERLRPDGDSPKQQCAAVAGPASKHESYRTFGAYRSFAESDAEVRNHWWSRTLEERMEALEELRIRVYGDEKINARISRVFGVPEPRRR